MITFYILIGKTVVMALATMAIFYYTLIYFLPHVMYNFRNESFLLFTIGYVGGGISGMILMFIMLSGNEDV